jgi:alkylhydroperoxidase family enzyme
MSRLPLIEIEQMSPEQREQYARFPSNLTRGLLLAEPPLSQALPMLANALRSSSLSPKIREAVILRVAALHHSDYERLQHAGQASKVGWSQIDRLPHEVAAILEFVDEAVHSGDVGDERFLRVREILSPADIATLILLIGHYMMIARFTAILRIDLDEKPDLWTQPH